MTKIEQQQDAVVKAVEQALHKVGLDRITQGEFFGTNQPKVIPWTQDQFTSA